MVDEYLQGYGEDWPGDKPDGAKNTRPKAITLPIDIGECCECGGDFHLGGKFSCPCGHNKRGCA